MIDKCIQRFHKFYINLHYSATTVKVREVFWTGVVSDPINETNGKLFTCSFCFYQLRDNGTHDIRAVFLPLL